MATTGFKPIDIKPTNASYYPNEFPKYEFVSGNLIHFEITYENIPGEGGNDPVFLVTHTVIPSSSTNPMDPGASFDPIPHVDRTVEGDPVDPGQQGTVQFTTTTDNLIGDLQKQDVDITCRVAGGGPDDVKTVRVRFLRL